MTTRECEPARISLAPRLLGGSTRFAARRLLSPRPSALSPEARSALVAFRAAFSMTMIMPGVAKHRRQDRVLEPVRERLGLDEEVEGAVGSKGYLPHGLPLKGRDDDTAVRASVLKQKFLSTLALDGDRAVTKPFDGGQDVVGGFGPAKGLGVGIAGVDVDGDGGLQRGSRAVGAALDLLVGEQREEALDLIDP